MDLKAFIKEAEAFVAVRRHRCRADYGSTPAAWTMLGSGYYGEAWEHEDFPGLVVKISGPAGWGEDCTGSPWVHSAMKRRKEDTPRHDAWPVFARHCMAHPHKHLPTVHHFEQLNQRMAWAVLKKYARWSGVTGSDFYHEVRRVLAGEQSSAAWPWMWPLVQMADGLYVSVDLHTGNVMWDADEGCLVITDPFSTTGEGPGGCSTYS